MSNITCQAHIEQGPNKGNICGKKCLEKYCIKHIRNKIRDDSPNTRYCDISRSCYKILQGTQVKCESCLIKARQGDRKRDKEKRDDTTSCINCASALTDDNIVVGKKGHVIRRCITCYNILIEIEKNRGDRLRNFKCEAFKNKDSAWNQYINSAKKRKIRFELTKESFDIIIVQPCYYCNHSIHEEINGIDRINNNDGYILTNVIPCCELCNIMKGSYHPIEFIDKIYSIHNYIHNNVQLSQEYITLWGSTCLNRTKTYYMSYIKSASDRNLAFELSEENYWKIKGSNCYLCGIKSENGHINGIDRFNNKLGYTIENSRPCCGHCNIIKKHIDHSQFINKINSITSQYIKLKTRLSSESIPIRKRINEERIKNTDMICDIPIIARKYKPVNELIVPDYEIPTRILDILEDLPVIPESPIIKQWKVKQIYKHFQANNMHPYKVWCETTHQFAEGQWTQMWTEFIASLHSTTYEIAEQIIRKFIESLRKLRHNILSDAQNHRKNPLERGDRQQWPTISVLRAYKEGKMTLFKEFQDKYTGDDPCSSTKRWQVFTQSLDTAIDDTTRKSIISKFMVAQRTRVYRKSKQ